MLTADFEMQNHTRRPIPLSLRSPSYRRLFFFCSYNFRFRVRFRTQEPRIYNIEMQDASQTHLPKVAYLFLSMQQCCLHLNALIKPALFDSTVEPSCIGHENSRTSEADIALPEVTPSTLGVATSALFIRHQSLNQPNTSAVTTVSQCCKLISFVCFSPCQSISSHHHPQIPFRIQLLHLQTQFQPECAKMTSQSQAGPKPFVFGAERSTSTSSSPGKQQKFFDCLEEQSQKHGPSSAKSTSPVPANVTLQTGNGEAEERPPSSGPARTFDNPFETTVDKFNRIGNILEPFNIIGPPTRSGAAPSSLFGKPPPSEPGVAANASEGYERTGGLFGLFGAPRPSTPVLSKPPSSDPDNSASSLFSHPPPAPTSGGLFPPSAALNKHEHRGVGSGQPDTHEPQAQTGENAPFEFNRPPDTHGPQAQTGKDAPFVFNLPPDTHGPQAQTGKNAPFVFNRPPSAASNKHGNQGAGFGQPDTHGPQAQLGENAPFVFSRPPDTHGPEAQTGKNAPFVFNRPPSPSGSTSSPLFGNPHPPNNGQAPVAPSEGMSFFGSARSPDSGNGPHSLFGHAPPTQASGGLFSASTPTQTPGGLFSGSKPARTSGGLFSASNPAQTSGGLFSASTPAQASGGLFSASKPAQASDDLFSASTPAQTSGGLFSASTPAQTYAGLFSASTPAQTSGGLFSPSTPAQTYAGLFSASTPAQTSGGLSSALTPNKHENQGVGLGQPSTHGLSAQSGSVPSSTFGGIPPPQSGNICSSIFGNLLSNSGKISPLHLEGIRLTFLEVPGNGLFGSYNPPSEYGKLPMSAFDRGCLTSLIAPGKGLFGNVNPPPGKTSSSEFGVNPSDIFKARGGLFGSDNTPSGKISSLASEGICLISLKLRTSEPEQITYGLSNSQTSSWPVLQSRTHRCAGKKLAIPFGKNGLSGSIRSNVWKRTCKKSRPKSSPWESKSNKRITKRMSRSCKCDATSVDLDV